LTVDDQNQLTAIDVRFSLFNPITGLYDNLTVEEASQMSQFFIDLKGGDGEGEQFTGGSRFTEFENHWVLADPEIDTAFLHRIDILVTWGSQPVFFTYFNPGTN